jgi:hypothetical protein
MLLPLFLAMGVTAVRDCAGDISPAIFNWKDKIKQRKLAGPDIFTSGPKLEGINSIWPGDLEIDNEIQLKAALDSLEKSKVDFIKITDNTLKPSLFIESIKQSRARGWKVSGHAPVQFTLQELSDAGLSTIEHMGYLMRAASTEEKRNLALERGAFAVIDSTLSADEVKEEAKRLSGGGIDYLYDPVGGDLGETCLRALTDDGQYLVIGFVAGIPKLPANQVLLRNRRVTGVDWGGWAGKNPGLNDRMLAEVMALIAAGELQPVEPQTYPLEQAAQALQDLEDRKVAGKIALIP